MKKHWMTALALAGATALAACGGGSGSGNDSGGPGGPGGGGWTPDTNKVEGPLDVLQEPLSDQVFAPLGSALAGTPLEGVLICADRMVVQDGLDIVDALALALQSAATGGADPAAALQGAAEDVAAGLLRTVNGLTGLIAALGGDAEACLNGGGGSIGDNPLAGTPLEAFGAALAPVLNQIRDAIGQGDGAGGPPDLEMLTSLVGQLQNGVDTAFALLPDELTGAPVVGPLFGVIQQLVADVGTTLGAVVAADPAAVGAALVATVENLLGTLLTGVVPVADLEGLQGDGGSLSDAITGGIGTLIASLQGVLGGGGGLPLDSISSLLDPLQSGVLDNLIAPIQDALAGIGGGGGNPLSAVIDALTGLFGGGVGGGGNPLQPVLDLIFGLIGGGGGGGGSCNIPLLCDLLGLG